MLYQFTYIYIYTRTHTTTIFEVPVGVYIYIYIYMRVCVCVCAHTGAAELFLQHPALPGGICGVIDTIVENGLDDSI